MRFSDIILSMPLGYCSIESRSLTRRVPKKIIPEPGYTLTQFMRKENSGNECDINNNNQGNVEKEADSENELT